MRERLRRWRVVLRKAMRRVVYSPGSANSVALGVSIGIFISFTPTIGFQMVLAALVATAFRASRLAAIAPVWISNPATIPAMFYGNYLVGMQLFRLRSPGDVHERFVRVAERVDAVNLSDFWSSMSAAFAELGKLGLDILAPLAIGGAIVGFAAAAASYPLALWTVRTVRARRQKSSIVKAQSRLARLELQGLYTRTESGRWEPIKGKREDEEAR